MLLLLLLLLLYTIELHLVVTTELKVKMKKTTSMGCTFLVEYVAVKCGGDFKDVLVKKKKRIGWCASFRRSFITNR